MSIVCGHKKAFMSQTGFYGVATGQVGRRPVGAWDKKRTRSGVIDVMCVGWRHVNVVNVRSKGRRGRIRVQKQGGSLFGGGTSDGRECSGRRGLASGLEALAVGVEVAEGGGKGEGRIGEDNFWSEAGERGKESRTNGEEEGGEGGGAETTVGV